MKRPKWYKDPEEVEESYWSDFNDPQNDLTHYEVNTQNEPSMHSPMDADLESNYTNNPHYNIRSTFIGADSLWNQTNISSFCPACARRKDTGGKYPLQVQKALEGLTFIEKHHQDDDEGNLVSKESFPF